MYSSRALAYLLEDRAYRMEAQGCSSGVVPHPWEALRCLSEALRCLSEALGCSSEAQGYLSEALGCLSEVHAFPLVHS